MSLKVMAYLSEENFDMHCIIVVVVVVVVVIIIIIIIIIIPSLNMPW
jgi:hypothetical protein